MGRDLLLGEQVRRIPTIMEDTIKKTEDNIWDAVYRIRERLRDSPSMIVDMSDDDVWRLYSACEDFVAKMDIEFSHNDNDCD